MSPPTKAERQWHARNDWERGKTQMENVSVRMPKLIVIPAGTRPHQCGCGMWQYFVREPKEGGETITRSVSISGKFYSKTAKAEITVPGCKGPTETSPGLGFDHHIDCALREQFRGRKKTPTEVKSAIAAAEQLAQRFGVRCTGAPNVNDCNGEAVVAILLEKRLFATPCSVHADRTTQAIERAGRARDATAHALEEFLVDRGPKVAEQFVSRATHLRDWHTQRGGITVPERGHL